MSERLELDRVPWRTVNDFIAEVGAARSKADFLARVLTAIQRLVPFDATGTFTEIVGKCLSAVGASSRRMNEFDDYYQYRNPLISEPRAVAALHGVYQVDWRIEFRETEFTRDFIVPGGDFQCLGLVYPAAGVVLGLNRTRFAPRHSARERAVLAVVGPHIGNFFAIWNKIGLWAPRLEAERIADSFGALTHREAEIVALRDAGLTPVEIATRLSISKRTVDSHLAHIYEKLGVHSRAEMRRLLHPAGDGPAARRV